MLQAPFFNFHSFISKKIKKDWDWLLSVPEPMRWSLDKSCEDYQPMISNMLRILSLVLYCSYHVRQRKHMSFFQRMIERFFHKMLIHFWSIGKHFRWVKRYKLQSSFCSLFKYQFINLISVLIREWWNNL